MAIIVTSYWPRGNPQATVMAVSDRRTRPVSGATRNRQDANRETVNGGLAYVPAY